MNNKITNIEDFSSKQKITSGNGGGSDNMDKYVTHKELNKVKEDIINELRSYSDKSEKNQQEINNNLNEFKLSNKDTFNELNLSLNKNINDLNTSLNTKIDSVKTTLLEKHTDLFKWFIGTIITVIIATGILKVFI